MEKYERASNEFIEQIRPSVLSGCANRCDLLGPLIARIDDDRETMRSMVLVSTLSTPLSAFGGLSALDYCHQYGPEYVRATLNRMYPHLMLN